MAKFGDTNYSWAQPDGSNHNEAFGPDGNRATAVVKAQVPPGGLGPAGAASIRRQAVKDLLEYPTLLTDVTSGIKYVNRHLPLAYGSPFNPSDVSDSVDEGFWASRILSGEGKGPAGQAAGNPADTQAGPLPLYRFYYYTLEFTDRTYDVLPDASVLAPGPLSTPSITQLTIGTPPGLFGFLPPAPVTYYVEITALSPDGETLASAEKSITVPATGAFTFSSIRVSWPPVTNALAYNIYISLFSLQEGVLAAQAVTGSPDPIIPGNLTYILTSPFGPAQTVPSKNTTAGPLYSTASSTGFPDEGYYLATGNGRVGSRYVTRLDEPGGYAQTIPAAVLTFSSGGAIPTGRMQVIPEVSRKLTWHMVPRNAIPVQAIISQLGTVNAQPFDGWPAGTLLFDSLEPRRYRDAMLNRCVDLTYVMVGKPNIDRFGVAKGHNAALKYFPAAGGQPAYVDYDYLYSGPNGTGNAPYRSSNFANLFRPPQG